jgi:aminoglycoside phosphotransferase (APT) family kinase protein
MNVERSAHPQTIGLDLGSLRRWFSTEVPDAEPPLSFNLIAGGHSNLTFRAVDNSGRSWVLRRPPVGPLRPGAHSMEREWRILSALQTSAVPVPPTVAFCADPGVIGAEFYVMDHVDGIVIDSEDRAKALVNSARRHLSDDAVATLAQLHQVDLSAVGRRVGAREESYIGRQLELWMRQMQGEDVARTRDIVEVHQVLSACIPQQQWTGLTHGDFRLGNMLVAPTGAIKAVLDWELWTVGDPLADLGWLAAWWTCEFLEGWSPERSDGFGTAEQLAAEYQARTGRDTSDLPFYMAFALWRLACISEGVYQRYAAGMMGQPTTPLDVLAARPVELASAARDVLR